MVSGLAWVPCPSVNNCLLNGNRTGTWVPGPFPSSGLHWSHGPSRAHLSLSWGFRQKLSFLIALTGALLPLPHPAQRAGEMGGCLFLFLGKLFLRSGGPGKGTMQVRDGDGDGLRCGVGGGRS